MTHSLKVDEQTKLGIKLAFGLPLHHSPPPPHASDL